MTTVQISCTCMQAFLQHVLSPDPADWPEPLGGESPDEPARYIAVVEHAAAGSLNVPPTALVRLPRIDSTGPGGMVVYLDYKGQEGKKPVPVYLPWHSILAITFP